MQSVEFTTDQNQYWDLLKSFFNAVVIDAKELIKHRGSKYSLSSCGVNARTELIIIDKIDSEKMHRAIQKIIPLTSGVIQVEEKCKPPIQISPIVLFTWSTNSNAPA